ncbi:MAG: hypothetical protein WC382_11015, partial [Methanoregulaceae archaeon]
PAGAGRHQRPVVSAVVSVKPGFTVISGHPTCGSGKAPAAGNIGGSERKTRVHGDIRSPDLREREGTSGR